MFSSLFKTLILFLLISYNQVNGSDDTHSRKLDESNGGDQSIKCTPSCIPTPSPPPPSPPPPCPPPPALPPPTPPAPKKPPSSQYCPPPPSFIYMTGPPGNLYPIDGDFSGGTKNLVTSISILIGLIGLMGLHIL